MENHYDAIIIGAGLGGLSCADFLARAGMKVLALEQHFQPGGYATSYKRKGRVFDVAHIINGVKKGEFMERILSYLDVYDKLEFFEFPVVAKTLALDKEVSWPADLDLYKKELINKFPLEEKGILECFDEMEIIWREMKSSSRKLSLFQLITYPFRFPRLIKYRKVTFKQFIDKFIKDEKLKFVLGVVALSCLGLPITRVPALAYISMIMVFTESSSGMKGGFQTLSDALAEQFEKDGGTLRLKTKVAKILVRKKTAVGVMLEDGTKVFAKYVISNADTRSTFLNLVGRENFKDKFIERVKNLEYSPSGIAINMLVNMKLPEKIKNCGVAESISNYDHGVESAMAERKSGFDFSKYRMSMCAKLLESDGNSELYMFSILCIPVSYEMWVGLDKKKYKKLKEEISDAIINEAERRLIPGLSKNIVFKEMATPLTYERYTSAYKGSWYDAAGTLSQYASRLGPKTLIKGLYLVGAKTLMGAGIGSVILTGLRVADMIAKGKVREDMRRRRP